MSFGSLGRISHAGRFHPPHGGYQQLLSYRKAEIVYDASLEEFLTDYRDFLRIRHLEEWPRDHPYVQRLRQLNRLPDATYETFRKGIEHPDPAICTNVIMGLIKVTSYLLDHQIRQLERAFVE